MAVHSTKHNARKTFLEETKDKMRIKEAMAMANYWMEMKLNSGKMYDQESMLPSKGDELYSYALCYFFLNKTSRSFARVIQSLHEELRHTVAIFYRKWLLKGVVLRLGTSVI